MLRYAARHADIPPPCWRDMILPDDVFATLILLLAYASAFRHQFRRQLIRGRHVSPVRLSPFRFFAMLPDAAAAAHAATLVMNIRFTIITRIHVVLHAAMPR